MIIGFRSLTALQAYMSDVSVDDSFDTPTFVSMFAFTFAIVYRTSQRKHTKLIKCNLKLTVLINNFKLFLNSA